MAKSPLPPLERSDSPVKAKANGAAPTPAVNNLIEVSPPQGSFLTRVESSKRQLPVRGVKMGSPFVLVLGWTGCKDRNLAKYTEVLAELGCKSLRSTCPTGQVFSVFRSSRRRFAHSLLSYIVDSSEWTSKDPFLVYAFSNGGCLVLEEILELLRTDPKFDALRRAHHGTVIDSAPSKLNLRVGIKVLKTVLPTVLVPFAVGAMAVSIPVGQCLTGEHRPSSFWKHMRDDPSEATTLFIYSVNDELVDVKGVDEVVEARKQHLGEGMVQVLRLEDSPHVQHLRSHPDEYVKALKSLISTVLRNQQVEVSLERDLIDKQQRLEKSPVKTGVKKDPANKLVQDSFRMMRDSQSNAGDQMAKV